MRTIKFRAWDKKTKKMINLREMETTISIGNHLCFGFEEWGHSYENRCIDENFELEQFTGLQDKNGKDIYEGDILLTNEAGWIAPVIYDYGSFYCKDAQGGFGCVTWEECEIIGNIHENPELL